jgi:hypothetical protein
LSGAGDPPVLSDIARVFDLLISRSAGRPRSMIDDSDMFLLCDDITCATTGSLRSMRGDPRLDAGEAEKGFVKVVGGVGRG